MRCQHASQNRYANMSGALLPPASLREPLVRLSAGLSGMPPPLATLRPRMRSLHKVVRREASTQQAEPILQRPVRTRGHAGANRPPHPLIIGDATNPPASPNRRGGPPPTPGA